MAEVWQCDRCGWRSGLKFPAQNIERCENCGNLAGSIVDFPVAIADMEYKCEKCHLRRVLKPEEKRGSPFSYCTRCGGVLIPVPPAPPPKADAPAEDFPRSREAAIKSGDAYYEDRNGDLRSVEKQRLVEDGPTPAEVVDHLVTSTAEEQALFKSFKQGWKMIDGGEMNSWEGMVLRLSLAAIKDVLIQKGLITVDELVFAQKRRLRREIKGIERALEQHMGCEVDLSNPPKGESDDGGDT